MVFGSVCSNKMVMSSFGSERVNEDDSRVKLGHVKVETRQARHLSLSAMAVAIRL